MEDRVFKEWWRRDEGRMRAGKGDKGKRWDNGDEMEKGVEEREEGKRLRTDLLSGPRRR